MFSILCINRIVWLELNSLPMFVWFSFTSKLAFYCKLAGPSLKLLRLCIFGTMRTTADKRTMVDGSLQGQGGTLASAVKTGALRSFTGSWVIETNRPVVQINFLPLEPQRLICAKDDWHGIGADIFKKWLDLLFQQKTSGSCDWKHHLKNK